MKKNNKLFTPLRLFSLSKTMIALLIGILLAAVIIFMVADEPLQALKLFLIGPFTSLRRFGNVIELMVPLTFTSVATCMIFRANQFSMIAEGSFFAGGFTCALMALRPSMPLHPLIALLVGGAVGGLMAAIPAVLKAKLDASELVASLMLNYIIFYTCQYFFINFYRDPKAISSATHELNTNLPVIVKGTRIHAGVFVAIAIVIAGYLFLFRTRWGYRIRTVGLNSKFAVYSGISAASVIIYSQVIGGMIAGLGGAVEILGMYKRFTWIEQPLYGFDGIIIATIARENPIFVPFATFFLAYMRIGADIMSRSSNVTNEVVAIIQGVIILLVSADAFLSRWRRRIVVKEAGLMQSKEGGAVG